MVFSHLLNDLGVCVVKRSAFGKQVLSWNHTEISEVARRRYLSDQETVIRYNQLLVDYYTGELYEMHPDCGLSYQPLYWQTQDGRLHFNRMKLSLLPTAILRSTNPHLFGSHICRLDFIAAKCAAGLGHELVPDLRRASVEVPSPTVEEFCEFVTRRRHILEKDPGLALQEALNEPDGSLVYQQGVELDHQAVVGWLSEPPLLVLHVNKHNTNNPQLLTQGKTDYSSICDK